MIDKLSEKLQHTENIQDPESGNFFKFSHKSRWQTDGTVRKI